MKALINFEPIKFTLVAFTLTAGLVGLTAQNDIHEN
jgi:hypothetical protein